MSTLSDKLSEAGLDISQNTIDGLSKIANMETTDFNAILKGVENIAGHAVDNETILNLKKHAMQFQQSIVKDEDFVDKLTEGSDAMDALSNLQDTLEYGKTAIDIFNNVGGMIDIVKDDSMTEAQKVELFEARFDDFKEQGADVVMAVFDSTFGSIPLVGSTLSNAVEDKMRNFVTSDDGLQKVSNDIGDFFDRGIDKFATETGLKRWLQNRFNQMPETTPSDSNPMTEEVLQSEEIMSSETDFVLPDELPATGGSLEGMEGANIAAELEVNMSALFQNLTNFTSSVSGI